MMKDEGRRREDQWFYEQEGKLIEKMRCNREARLLAKLILNTSFS